MNMMSYIDRLSRLINVAAYKSDFSVIENAEHAVRHEMNVLGSGWIRNHYGMKTLGFEDNNYSDQNVTFEIVRASMPHEFEERAHVIDDVLAGYSKDYCPIDWQIDLKSGARYELIPASQIKFGILEGVDAKMTADMNRLYPLVTLGRAFLSTGNKKYLDEFICQFLDWTRMNPRGYGAAWRGNMNVSIRIVNILCGFSLISGFLDEKKDSVLLSLVRETVDDHIRYISENLEFTELPTSLHPNHYIANLTGLLVASAFAGDDNPSAAAWERIALRELKLTFDWQINSDGIDFEATTMYHAFAIEMFVYALIIVARIHGAQTKREITDWIRSKFGESRMLLIRKMFQALDGLTACNGLLPVVGDADSGRYVYLEKGDTPDRDRRFLLPVGAALFSMSEIPGAAGCDGLTAKAFFSDYGDMPLADRKYTSCGYPVSGFYTARDSKNDWYSFINCAPIGTAGLGSHAHNDRLEVLLTVRNNDIIIDPGVYAYTASRYWRNIYRDSYVHSSVTLGGIQPNRLSPPDAWWGYHDDTKCKCLNWTVFDDGAMFEGESYAYERFEIPVVHNRSVSIKTGEMTIVDRFRYSKAGKPEYSADWNFLLGPSVCVHGGSGTATVKLTAGDVTAEIAAEKGTFTVEEGSYAPVYGAKAKTMKLSLHMDNMPDINTITIKWR